ncbi:MAG: hypothetical protein PHQ96_02895 [Candidatus Omnitrophica bacterium]|nr:hypothetical protein [Candidatus Omnitrophota bacterium]
MGKYKREMARIHSKKVKKARLKVQAFVKGEVPYEKLSRRAKELLAKRKRKEAKPA